MKCQTCFLPVHTHDCSFMLSSVTPPGLLPSYYSLGKLQTLGVGINMPWCGIVIVTELALEDDLCLHAVKLNRTNL